MDLGLTSGQWYHIAVIYDGTQSVTTDRVKIYVNGRSQTTNVKDNSAPSALTANVNALVLGAKSDGSGNFL